ncbi:hypothetical protein F5887DRAFT_958025, partial [Amanita rubescens]
SQSRTPLIVCRLCKSVMEELLRTVKESRTEVSHSDTSQDLVRLLERALSMPSRSSASTTCRCCSLAPMIIDIADWIQPKYNRTLEERLLDWIRQLRATRRESIEDLPNNCLLLKEQLQLIMDVQGSKTTDAPSSSTSAGMLGGAHDLRIDGGNITNVAGSSNLLVFVKQEPGIGIRNALVLLLVAFLVFCLL